LGDGVVGMLGILQWPYSALTLNWRGYSGGWPRGLAAAYLAKRGSEKWRRPARKWPAFSYSLHQPQPG